MPRRHVSCYACSTDDDYRDLAAMIQNLLRKLDRALSMPPYNYVIHTSPLQGRAQ